LRRLRVEPLLDEELELPPVVHEPIQIEQPLVDDVLVERACTR
jgi:hypothetical protein